MDPRNIWYAANLTQDVAFNRNIKIWFALGREVQQRLSPGEHRGQGREALVRHQSRNWPLIRLTARSGRIRVDGLVHVCRLLPGDLAGRRLGIRCLREQARCCKAVENEYASDQGLGDDNEFAAYNATECTDIQYPTNVTAHARARTAATTRSSPFLTWDNYWFNGPCLFWPAAAHSRDAIPE